MSATGGVFVVAGKDVGADLQRHPDVGVTKALGDDFHRHPGRERRRGVVVAQVVQTDRRKAGRGGERGDLLALSLRRLLACEIGTSTLPDLLPAPMVASSQGIEVDLDG